jgi:hypothetical protein
METGTIARRGIGGETVESDGDGASGPAAFLRSDLRSLL